LKKYLLLSLFGLLSLNALFYFYYKTDSQLTLTHEDVHNLFLRAGHAEAVLEKEILKAKTFIIKSYDPLVRASAELNNVCIKMKKSRDGIYKSLNKSIDQSIENYCSFVEKKLQDTEYFKSKNAIFRNSVFFLQKLSAESFLNKKNNAKHILNETKLDLIKVTLGYALVSTSDAKNTLKETIAKIELLLNSEQDIESSEITSILMHAKTILRVNPDIETLVNGIVRSQTNEALSKFKKNYMKFYLKSQSSFKMYRKILLSVCIGFLVLIILAFIKIAKTAEALNSANETLEQKVEERTQSLKESQETIIQQQQTLISTAKFSALGEMAGGIAHEINTPLAIISLRASQLEECILDNDIDSLDFLKMIEAIKKTTDRIAKIIQGLRFFAREGHDLPFEEISVKHLINETLSLCHEKMHNHGVLIETMDSDYFHNSSIRCRSVEISQVLLNLFNNSFDAVQETKDKWIKIAVEEFTEYVSISVTDSGPGIPVELHEKILQPFFTTKEIGKGTGIGLSLSRGIITSHNGKLFLDTESPNTRFVVLLPKSPSLAEEVA
jgi:signal transduction histidine kinase